MGRKSMRIGMLIFTVLTGLLLSCFSMTSAKEITIKDVLETDETYSQIQWVLDQNYMSLSLGRFLPNNYVKRNEFALILSKLVGDVASLSNPVKPFFTDVKRNDQYYRYIETEKQYMSYSKNGKGYVFKPNTFLTREEAALSIVKIMKYDSDEALSELANSELSLDSMVQDANKVTPAFQKYVAIAVQNQLVDVRQDGTDLYFDPKKNITRKQLAAFIYNAKQNPDFSVTDDTNVIIGDEDAKNAASSNKDTNPEVKSIIIHLPKTTISTDEMIKVQTDIQMSSSEAPIPKVSYSTSDANIAMIDGTGNILPVRDGSVDIIATAGEQSAKVRLTINQSVKVAKIVLNVDKTKLKVGDVEKADITIQMMPETADKAAYTVSSSNPSVVFIDSVGNIKAVAPGNAELTLQCGDKSTTVSMTVVKPQENGDIPEGTNGFISYYVGDTKYTYYDKVDQGAFFKYGYWNLNFYNEDSKLYVYLYLSPENAVEGKVITSMQKISGDYSGVVFVSQKPDGGVYSIFPYDANLDGRGNSNTQRTCYVKITRFDRDAKIISGEFHLEDNDDPVSQIKNYTDVKFSIRIDN